MCVTYGLHGDMHKHVENTMAAEFCKFTKSYGSYPFHNTLQVFTLLGVVASRAVGW